MKRTAATLLWTYAFWYLGAMLASIYQAPEAFGPILGIAAGVLVGVDPRGHFWAKSVKERSAAAPISMASPEGAR